MSMKNDTDTDTDTDTVKPDRTMNRKFGKYLY